MPTLQPLPVVAGQPGAQPDRPGVPTPRAAIAARWLRCVAAALAAAALSGCGSLPPAPPAAHSRALPPDAASALVQTAAASLGQPGHSGAHLLPSGLQALDTRLQLIARASRSLDVQYYVLDDDATGRLLLARLAQAADRGVRVRLLVDDLYTQHSDPSLRAMAALPGVEVRLFNPFCCARSQGLASRFAASLAEVYRLNHRMHNKLLVADGAWAITGGRNIADDYFQRGSAHHFIDLDVLLAGPVVTDLAASFDRYWNSPVVRPIAHVPPAALDDEALRARIHALTAHGLDALPLAVPEADVLGQPPLGPAFDRGRLALTPGQALVIADPPDKWQRDADQAWQDSLAYQALMKIWTAEREVLITSPYLIPGPLGIAAFEALRQRQVQVTVLTNSLAATDEPLVHTGYARYRPRLVDAGVALFELSPSRTRADKRLGVFGSSSGRLHAKTAVVDGDKSFIGTMNLDPRSRTQNTELGVFFQSPVLAQALTQVINANRQLGAYQVGRSASGALQWRVPDGPGGTPGEVLTSEPESTVWLQLHNLLLGLLVPEQLL
jgi:cardiolipin synthase C